MASKLEKNGIMTDRQKAVVTPGVLREKRMITWLMKHTYITPNDFGIMCALAVSYAIN